MAWLQPVASQKERMKLSPEFLELARISPGLIIIAGSPIIETGEKIATYIRRRTCTATPSIFGFRQNNI